MRILSNGQRTRTAEPPIETVPARAHVEVREEEPAPQAVVYQDISALIAGLPAKAGSLTDGFVGVLSPLPDRQSEALSFVRDLFAYAWVQDPSIAPAPANLVPTAPSLPSPKAPTHEGGRAAIDQERPAELLRALRAGPQSARELSEVIGVTAASALALLRALEMDGSVRAVSGAGRVKRWELSS